MKVSVQGYIYHKTSERYADCFDRYDLSTKNNKFAISDGVSKSFFSGIWAELLVNSFVNTEGKVNLTNTELLALIQNQWLGEIEEIVNRPNQKFFVKNLHAQRKSAAATFVGLHFFNSKGTYEWEAFALGDSFMFFVPEATKNISENFKQVQFLSSKKNFEFDNYPDFFDSRSKISKGKIKQISGDLRAGIFYIMTDALSQWFITEKQTAVDEIGNWTSQSVFENRIQLLRNGSLQNDDVAILTIHVQGDDESVIQYTDIQVTDFKKLQESERRQIEIEEAEWVPLENELREKFEIERVQAEKNLAEKQRYEKSNYYDQLIEYVKRRQENAKEKLVRQHAKELEQFEREWKRELEYERNKMEDQLAKKQESERLDLGQHIKNRFEEAKHEKRKSFVPKGYNQVKKIDEITQPTTDKEGRNVASIKSNSIEEVKNENFSKNEEIKKKKGFWESTIEMGSEAIDAFSNLMRKKEYEPDKYIEKQDKNSKTRIIKVTGEDDNIKKKKNDEKKDNDSSKDISSITDKF